MKTYEITKTFNLTTRIGLDALNRFEAELSAGEIDFERLLELVKCGEAEILEIDSSVDGVGDW